MLTSFVTVKTATKPNSTFQPLTAAFFHLAKPLHMVVFSTLEIVLLSPVQVSSSNFRYQVPESGAVH